jgi:hypothetical protein
MISTSGMFVGKMFMKNPNGQSGERVQGPRFKV